MQELIEQLRRAGYKITPPRRAILEAIEEGGEHLAPMDILDRARESYPKIGRATVYRTLDLLMQLGVIRPIYMGNEGGIHGPSYFIRATGGHHHMVCNRCSKVIDFDRCVAEELTADLAARYGFAAQSHLLEFYGLCAECQG